MGKITKIQWTHTTVNPVSGCDGCELYPSHGLVLRTVLDALPPDRRDQLKPMAERLVAGGPQHTKRNLEAISSELASSAGDFGVAQRIQDAVGKLYVCYASTLHRFFNANGTTKGYAFPFEKPEMFPGRMQQIAKLPAPREEEVVEKPWLHDMRRLIFVSDMGDALSHSIPFEYLEKEVISNVTSPQGSRHVWQWLSKRPAKMAAFAKWLAERGIPWPDNLVAMTTVTSQATVGRVDALRQVPARFRGLSLEPLWSRLDIDLDGIDWVIVGGESGGDATPFHLEWAQEIREECDRKGVAFFMKQLGRRAYWRGRLLSLKDLHGGDWAEWPEEFRVRELPSEWRNQDQSPKPTRKES